MFPLSSVWKTTILSLMTLSFSCLFLYLSPVQDKMPMCIAKFVYELGTSWLIVFLYLFIIFILLDVCAICHIIPKDLTHNSLPFSVGIPLFLVLILFCGNIRYNHKYRRKIDIQSDKISHPLKLLMCSDLHLGYNNGVTEFHRWVEMINDENPDMILIAGDIIDGNIRPLYEEKIYEEFKSINAPIYACLGNHEYLAGRQESIDFYEKSGITLLIDDVAETQGIRIIGRDDRSNINRKTLKSLVTNKNDNSFTILLDHQPYQLEEAEICKIDLQLSGHTHHGQVWPLNWITDMLYECSYGEYKKGDTQYFVSSGLGIWGGKFRICTTSEYVVINIE